MQCSNFICVDCFNKFFYTFTIFKILNTIPISIDKAFIIYSILELRATGLMDEWNKKFNPEPTECLMKYKEKANDKTRLSLRNLTSAFVLVVFGWVLSTIIFVAELVRRFLYSKNTFCSAKQSCFNIASILPSRRSNTPERNTE